MTVAEQHYLVERSDREDEGVRIIVELPFLAEVLFKPLGLNSDFAWFVLRMNKQRLCRAFEGDVDILGGALEWNDPNQFQAVFDEQRQQRPDCPLPILERLTPWIVAQNGGIKWPPSTAYLVAVEAKCCYLSPQAQTISRQNLKSTKTSKQDIKRLRAKISDLLEMGFDRVALLDVIANPPVAGTGSDPWISAFGVAGRSREAFDNDLMDRLPASSPAGHYVHSLGAVAGGLEMSRGACPVDGLRRGVPNPLLSNPEIQMNRAEVNDRLRREFERLPAPRTFRPVFLDCQKCHRIHSILETCK